MLTNQGPSIGLGLSSSKRTLQTGNDSAKLENRSEHKDHAVTSYSRPNPNPYTRMLLQMIILITGLAFFIKPTASQNINPIFDTTLSNFQTDYWVLNMIDSTQIGGYFIYNTVVSFSNTYNSPPNVGLGIGQFQSYYNSTTRVYYFDFEITVEKNYQSSAQIKVSATLYRINKISVNYIVCDPNFWLDISSQHVDICSNAQPLCSKNTATRSSSITLKYKAKSNSTNARVYYNTIGLSMIRESNIYDLKLAQGSKSLQDYTVDITVGGNNSLKWIRIVTYSYETIVTIINPPFYINHGFLTQPSGQIDGASGLSISDYGIIYTGMVDWKIDDSNNQILYNMSLTENSYFLQTDSSLTRFKSIFIWYRQETCPEQYYIVLEDHQCAPCHFTCLTCTSGAQTACLTCHKTRKRQSSNSTCNCIQKFVQSGDQTLQCIPQKCSIYCLTCGTMNLCDTCNKDLRRVLVDGNCVCPDFTIDTSVSQGEFYCYSCHDTCKTCEKANVETACLTCQPTQNRVWVEYNNTCSCQPKYYQDDSSTDPKVCKSCDHTCSTCKNIDTCWTCNITQGRYKDQAQSLCLCKSNTYDDNQNEKCIACHITCMTCDANGCLTCDSTHFRQPNNPSATTQCSCINGYFDDSTNALCKKCLFHCQTCEDDIKCLTCDETTNHRIKDSDTELCQCQQRYYSEEELVKCNSCDVSCLTCDGSEPTDCLSCQNNGLFQLSEERTCVCIDGYYFSTNECKECHYSCKTCADGDNCLTCNADNYRVQSAAGVCDCLNKYYDKGVEKCQPCNYKCLTCSNPDTASNLCDTCDSDTRDDADLNECPCLQGYYDDGMSSSCLPCQLQCLSCTNGNNCSACTPSKQLTLSNYCVCKSGTLSSSCIPCEYQCQQCAGTPGTCTKCNGTAYRFSDSTDTCVCYDGYFDNNVEECSRCDYTCQTCVEQPSCLTCPTYRIKNDTTGKCDCINEYFENSTSKRCIACHYSCQNCESYSVCTECSPQNKRIQNENVEDGSKLCICEDGFYDDGQVQQCHQCDPSCQTCIAHDNCLTCDSSLNRQPFDNTCPCIGGYFEDTDNLCKQCHYSCETCANGGECLTCVVGREFIGGDGNSLCKCSGNTYNNPSSNQCQTCQYPCTECIDTSTKCTGCDDQHELIQDQDAGTTTCQCLVQTFESGASCQSCLPECYECKDDVSCDTCELGAYRHLVDSLCPCVDGYYDQPDELLVCQKCHYSCITCSNRESCDTCADIRVLVTNSTCQCPPQGFYDLQGTPACQQCHQSCLECVGPLESDCSKCIPGNNRDLITLSTDQSDTQCECIAGYFDDTSIVCSKCNYKCTQCGNFESCSSCDSSQPVYRDFNSTTQLCECMAGYYDVSDQLNCQPCSYTCATCSGTATSCASCQPTETHHRNFDEDSSACPCEQGYFDFNNTQICQTCMYSCSTCDAQNQCLTCPDTREPLSVTKQCICEAGKYDVAQQLECVDCHPLCGACTDYDICQTCNQAQQFREPINGSCVCMDGYYDIYQEGSANDQDKICKVCHYSCQKCVSESQCKYCLEGSHRQYNQSTKLCTCVDGYYDEDQEKICKQCLFGCAKCLDGGTCQQCKAGRQPNGQKSVCSCIESYYTDTDQECEKCPPQCSTCSDSSTCTACKNPRTLSDNKCICDKGTYPKPLSPDCEPCQYSCETCVSSLKCTTCSATVNRYMSGLFCKCQQGYYDDGSKQQCQPCLGTCKSCTQGATCESCYSDKNRVFNSNKQLCDCEAGYFEDPDTNQCKKCHYSCLQCTGAQATDCSNCAEIYKRKLQSSSCICPPQGYFDDSSSSACQKCDNTCKSCQSSSATCTFCRQEDFRSLNLENKLCDCNRGYFSNPPSTVCSKCSYKCATCQETSTKCTECDQTVLRTGGTPDCDCGVGYFDDNFNSQCVGCSQYCEKCTTSAEKCQSCHESHHRQLSNSKCKCKQFYYDVVGSVQCVPCRHSCATCKDSELCLTCPNNRNYANQVCTCKDKFFENGQLQCGQCNYSCRTCSDSNECKSCSKFLKRIFDNQTNFCVCLDRYYDVKGQQKCQKCDRSCATCSDGTSCLTCPDNTNKVVSDGGLCQCIQSYYPNISAGQQIGQSSVCFKCHYSCETCDGRSAICTSCDPSANRNSTLFQNTICRCMNGYFDDSKNEACVNCAQNCQTCWNELKGSCQKCNPGSYFLKNQCFTDCPDQYRNSEDLDQQQRRVCQPCTSSCLQCDSSSTICTKCMPSHRLFFFNQTHTTCVSQCPKYYYDPSNIQCIACLSPCLQCSAKYTCKTCIQGFYLLNGFCLQCHNDCRSCSGSTAYDCKQCKDGYFLNSNNHNLCRKLHCGAHQYVDSVVGCANCTEIWSNSLTCTSLTPVTCKKNYMLQQQSQNANNKITMIKVCKSCQDVPGYHLTTLTQGSHPSYQCRQICGDGITIKDLCDDGNVLNGDGCSSLCKIEDHWMCKKDPAVDQPCKLQLVDTPEISVESVLKIQGKNQIEILLQLTIAVRLVKENFIIGFQPENGFSFNYTVTATTPRYTQYKLNIVYYDNGIQNTRLSIKVVSPIAQQVSKVAASLALVTPQPQYQPQNSRSLQQQSTPESSISPLEISLSLSLSLTISTQPPAYYISEQTRHVYSDIILYILMAFQLVFLLAAFFLIVIKKVRFMLAVIDLYTSLRILYVLGTFGLYQISDMLPLAVRGLQPFIHPFGPYPQPNPNASSSFFYFGYTLIIFSSCIIQLLFLSICLVVKHLVSKPRTRTRIIANYYMNAFMYCFSIDLILSCVSVFGSVSMLSPGEGAAGAFSASYSWAVAIVLMVFILSFIFMYIAEGKYLLARTQTVLPSKSSFATSQLDLKEKVERNSSQMSKEHKDNRILDDSEFRQDHSGSLQGLGILARKKSSLQLKSNIINNDQVSIVNLQQCGEQLEQQHGGLKKEQLNTQNSRSQKQNLSQGGFRFEVMSSNNLSNYYEDHQTEVFEQQSDDEDEFAEYGEQQEEENDEDDQKADAHGARRRGKSRRRNHQRFSIFSYVSPSIYDNLPLYDLSPCHHPGSNPSNDSLLSNKISLYHLPIFNFLLPLLIVLIASLINVDSNDGSENFDQSGSKANLLIRTIILFLLILGAMCYWLFVDRVQRINRNARSIKIIGSFIIYLMIVIALVVSAAIVLGDNNSGKTYTSTTQWTDAVCLVLIMLGLLWNLTLFVVNVKYSQQYKQRLVWQHNEQVIQRNRAQAQEARRKKIYTGRAKLNESLSTNNNSPTKNVFRRHHNALHESHQSNNFMINGSSAAVVGGDSAIHNVDSYENQSRSNILAGLGSRSNQSITNSRSRMSHPFAGYERQQNQMLQKHKGQRINEQAQYSESGMDQSSIRNFAVIPQRKNSGSRDGLNSSSLSSQTSSVKDVIKPLTQQKIKKTDTDRDFDDAIMKIIQRKKSKKDVIMAEQQSNQQSKQVQSHQGSLQNQQRGNQQQQSLQQSSQAYPDPNLKANRKASQKITIQHSSADQYNQYLNNQDTQGEGGKAAENSNKNKDNKTPSPNTKLIMAPNASHDDEQSEISSLNLTNQDSSNFQQTSVQRQILMIQNMSQIQQSQDESQPSRQYLYEAGSGRKQRKSKASRMKQKQKSGTNPKVPLNRPSNKVQEDRSGKKSVDSVEGLIQDLSIFQQKNKDIASPSPNLTDAKSEALFKKKTNSKMLFVADDQSDENSDELEPSQAQGNEQREHQQQNPNPNRKLSSGLAIEKSQQFNVPLRRQTTVERHGTGFSHSPNQTKNQPQPLSKSKSKQKKKKSNSQSKRKDNPTQDLMSDLYSNSDQSSYKISAKDLPTSAFSKILKGYKKYENQKVDPKLLKNDLKKMNKKRDISSSSDSEGVEQKR